MNEEKDKRIFTGVGKRRTAKMVMIMRQKRTATGGVTVTSNDKIIR